MVLNTWILVSTILAHCSFILGAPSTNKHRTNFKITVVLDLKANMFDMLELSKEFYHLQNV